jgi:predicted ATPase
LLREKQVTHIPLRRLPQAETGELLATLSGQTPPPSATRILFDHTEGNPFFVEEVFRHQRSNMDPILESKEPAVQ